MKTLIIAGHPDLKTSVANKAIIKEFEKLIPEADIRKLGELYADGKIDVKAEQEALLNADTIVFQFPMQWFSVPALMKKWIDEVFEYGFAYGTGAKLGGKKLFVCFTTGADAAAYTGGEGSILDIKNVVDYFKAIAVFCGLNFVGCKIMHGVGQATRTDAEVAAKQKELSKNFAQNVVKSIKE